jgi:hypothetical protein
MRMVPVSVEDLEEKLAGAFVSEELFLQSGQLITSFALLQRCNGWLTLLQENV